MQKFSETLARWYEVNKRDLPWRNTNDPYFIWLSEIILQQTRVEQGLPYYLKFTAAFATIELLAAASQDEVLRLWQGLGYYSRGRNLHFTAKQIVNNFNAKFPTKYDDLIKLKGIGAYTGAAIASFCANEPRAVVDGNVYRVLARYFGIESDISLASTQKEFQQLALDQLNKKNPGLHNQAIMEFGALQCVPKSPNCNACPLINSCFSFQHQKTDSLPFKSKKLKQKVRYFNYLVIRDKDSTFIKKRLAGDIWEGLYEFPLIETKENMDENSILDSKEFATLVKAKKYEIKQISQQFKHHLTHQTIFCRFIEIKLEKLANKMHFESVLWLTLENYPKPILIQRYYAQK